MKTAAMLEKLGGITMLDLQNRKISDINSARSFLMQFPGVGRKVADCVCLYSLDFHSIVPVDTHIFALAQRRYVTDDIKKNNSMHDAVQSVFVKIFGDYAGWAHCILFASELPSVNNLIETSLKKSKISKKRRRSE
jgi:3-methyladenine DNA glycosylase/8-oxoguanine DNA glycosylase